MTVTELTPAYETTTDTSTSHMTTITSDLGGHLYYESDNQFAYDN